MQEMSTSAQRTQGWLRLWEQYVALLKKLFTIAWRNPKSSLAQVLVGALVCALLAIFQAQANYILSVHTLHEPEIPVATVPKCVPGKVSKRPVLPYIGGDPLGYQPGCTTLMYAPDSALTRALMTRVAATSGLSMSSDVLPVPGVTSEADWPPIAGVWVNASMFSAQDMGVCSTAVGQCDTPEGLLSGDCLPCAFARDNRTVTEWALEFPNSTQNVVWAWGAYANDSSLSISYNISVTQYPFFADAHTASVKLAIDTAVLQSAVAQAHAEAGGGPGEEPPVVLNVATKAYPKPQNRISGFDIFAQSGPQWMFVVPSVIFFHVLTELVAEKESKLRVSMMQMGLHKGAYWAAWATYAAIFSAVSTCVLTASGHAAGFAWFTNTHPAVPLLLFWLFGLAMVGIAVLASSLISSTKTAQTTAFTVAIVGFVFTAIISSGYGGLLDLMYSTEVYPWVIKVREAIQLLPPYQLARAFSDIAALSSSEIDFSTQTITAGPGFSWSDLYAGRSMAFFGYTCNIPPAVQALWWLLGSTVIFFTLGIYADAVLPGPQGSPAHPLFFLGCTYKLRVDEDASHADDDVDTARQAQGVGVEQERARSRDESAEYAIRVHSLRVVYRKEWSALLFALTGIDIRPWLKRVTAGWGGRSSGADAAATQPTGSAGRGAGDVVAVKDMCLVVRPHEIVALLGHNGAGKTTTINVLTGLITASSGAAEVAGHDVSTATGLAAAQNELGVCPQHDLLWPQLTARETLFLFCSVKGVPKDKRTAEVDRVLKLVALTDVSGRAVGGFSGGMKRRLSVAIAALGGPRVLMLDEPTTGMDVVHKQEVWRLMEGLRATSAVVLTTHSMEEAGTLADRVAIMAAGRLCAVETPLRLKAAYGDGYRLSMVLHDSSDRTLDRVRTAVTGILPSAKLGLRDASSVAFIVPFADAAGPAMPRLLEWCDLNSPGGSDAPSHPCSVPLLEDYGVSGPDLESVFVKVSAMAKFGLAQAALDVEHHGDKDGDEDGDGEDAGADTGEGGGQGYTALPNQTNGQAQGSTSGPSTPPSRSFAALCAKNTTLLLRQRGLCLCQVLTPIMVLTLLVVLRTIIHVEAGDSAVVLVPSITVPLNLDSLTDPVPSSAYASQGPAGAWMTHQPRYGSPVNMSAVDPLAEVLHRVWLAHDSPLVSQDMRVRLASGMEQQHAVGRRLQLRDDDDDDSSTHKSLEQPDCLLFFLYGVQPKLGVAGAPNASALASAVGNFRRVYLPEEVPPEDAPPPATYANATGLLRYIPSAWCTLKNGSRVPAPYWDSRVDVRAADAGADVPSTIDVELDGDLDMLNRVDVPKLLVQPPCWPRTNSSTWPVDREQSNCPAYILPDGSVTFRDVMADPVTGQGFRLEYVMQVNDVTSQTNYHRPNNFSRAIFRHGGNISAPLTLDPARLGLMDSLLRAFLPWANLTGPASRALLRPPTVVAVSTMPAMSVTNLLQIVEIVGGVLHSVVLTLPLPLFVFLPVLEKSEKLLDLQQSMGMRLLPYLTVNYVLNLGVYSAVAGVYWAASRYLSFTFFMQTSPAVLLAILFGYGLALVSTSNLLASFLWSRQAAVILGFTVALLGPLMATAIAAGIYGFSLPISIGGGMPDGYYALPVLGPIFGVTRALYLGTFNCLAKVQCFQDPATTFARGTEMRASVGSLYISAVLYFVLANYLDQVLPRTYGVRKHPLFFIPEATRDRAWAWLTGAKQAGVEGQHAPQQSIVGRDAASNTAAPGAVQPGLFSYVSRWASRAGLSLPSAVAAYARGEDGDVHGHRALVEQELWPKAHGADAANTDVVSKYPVLIHALRKEFRVPAQANKKGQGQGSGHDNADVPLLAVQSDDDGSTAPRLAQDSDLADDSSPYSEVEGLALGTDGVKVAVSDVSLAIQAGSCFGLLGENGAGKTTTLHMLQGLFPPTAGSALVCGHDIVTESDAVRLSLGICPQHDILWPSLTVAEHLLYYARLKGVPRHAEASAVQHAAASVGLAGVSNRASADLSGGMKRRLSLACSLIGGSKVVLLDEPSTGLDPASKRKLLRLIDTARRKGTGLGRVFVLISHDLGEVEALASRVAVMTYGRVRALGTPQHLKNRYGEGYILHAAYSADAAPAAEEGSETGPNARSSAGSKEQDTGRRAEAFLLGLFPSARVESRYLGSLTLTLPTVDPSTGRRLSLATAFSTLQARAVGGGITDWSLGQPSLEAAFARIVRHFRLGNEEEAPGFAQGQDNAS